MEVVSLAFRNIRARKRGHKKLADDNQAEQMRVDVPQSALGKIYQKNFFLVHYFSEIKRRFFLSDYGTHNVVAEEIIKLAGDIRHDIGQRRFASGFFGHILPK